MKIIHLCDSINIQGGYEKVVVFLTEQFVSNGHKVEIWLWNEKIKCFYELDKDVKIVSLGSDLKNFLNLFTPFRIIMSLLIKWKVYFKYKKLLQRDSEIDFVLIHRHGLSDNLDHFDGLHKNSYNILHVDYNNKYCNHINKLNLFFRLKAKTKNNLIVLTEDSKDAALLDGCKNVFKINNALTFNSNKKSKLDQNVIISVGRYGYQKNFELLINAFALVCNKNSTWKLKIVGSQVENNSSLKALIFKHGIHDRIELLNEQKNIVKQYLSASIYVLPSRWEGFPLVVLEAMECGLPILSSNINGIREVLNESNSLFFESDNVIMLSEKLECLINNENIRKTLSKNAINSVQKFKPESIMLQWENFFNEQKKHRCK